MKNEDIQIRESVLQTILETMEVPESRKDITKLGNVRWLNRNLKIENKNHPWIENAMSMIVFLARNR